MIGEDFRSTAMLHFNNIQNVVEKFRDMEKKFNESDEKLADANKEIENLEREIRKLEMQREEDLTNYGELA